MENEPLIPNTEEIAAEFGNSIEVSRLHRFMITTDGTVHFGLLGSDGKNNYFKATPEVMSSIALEMLNLAGTGNRVKAGDPNLRVQLAFPTTAVFTLIPKGNGANGAIEFQFLTDNETTLSTMIGPQLAAEMTSSLLHILSTMPSPPKIHELRGLHSKLKGSEHTGAATEIFFGQSYDTRILKIIGILVIRANLLEGAMARMLAALLEVSVERGEAIFYSSQNMKARSDMLRATIITSNLSEVLKTRVTKCIDKVDKISRRRNQLVHGEWSFSKEKFSVRERKALGNSKVQDAIETYKSIEEICTSFHDETVLLDLTTNNIIESRKPSDGES